MPAPMIPLLPINVDFQIEFVPADGSKMQELPTVGNFCGTLPDRLCNRRLPECRICRENFTVAQWPLLTQVARDRRRRSRGYGMSFDR